MPMDPETKDMLRQAARFSAVGIEMGAAVVIGYAIGFYLDRWLGTEPYLKVFWTVCGFGAAFKAVWAAYREAKKRTMGDSAGDSGAGEKNDPAC